MAIRLRGLLALCALVAGPALAQTGPTDAQKLPYRLAFGLSPSGLHAPDGFGISTSVDIFAPQTSRLVLRLDGTVVSNERNNSIAAVTVDAAYRIPIGRFAAYPVLGAGIRGGLGTTVVGGAGMDFTARGRAMFSEFRVYGDPGVMLMKMGFRF